MSNVFSGLVYGSAASDLIFATREDGSVVAIEPATVDLWALAIGGDLGVIAAYVPPPVEPKYTDAQGAKKEIAIWIARFLAQLTGYIPADEKLSWGDKRDAAVAYQAGTASADQLNRLKDEAEITGEEIADLVEKILSKAALYQKVVSRTSGLRRKMVAAIDETLNPFDYELIVEAGQTEAALLASALGLDHLID